MINPKVQNPRSKEQATKGKSEKKLKRTNQKHRQHTRTGGQAQEHRNK